MLFIGIYGTAGNLVSERHSSGCNNKECKEVDATYDDDGTQGGEERGYSIVKTLFIFSSLYAVARTNKSNDFHSGLHTKTACDSVQLAHDIDWCV